MKFDLQGFAQNVLWNKLELHHVLVRQHNREIGSFHFRRTNRRDNIHSVSKSFVSVAVGMALEEGILRLDEKIADIFPNKLPAEPSANLLQITVRDMIMMATGHDQFILEGHSSRTDKPGRDSIENEDWVQYALQFEVPYQPGTYWQYNNFGPFLCSVILQDRTGQNLRDWLKPRLFDPLGIPNPQWFESASGNYTLGCGGLHLSTGELSRFAQMVLDRGSYAGKQLVAQEWIAQATSNLISNQKQGVVQPADACAGYGYFFWRCARDNAFSGRGWGGQHIIILPGQNACVTIMSHEFNAQAIYDCVWDHIVPQLKGSC